MLRAMQFEVQFRGFTVRVTRLGEKIGIRLDDGGVVPDMTPEEAAELATALGCVAGHWRPAKLTTTKPDSERTGAG